MKKMMMLLAIQIIACFAACTSPDQTNAVPSATSSLSPERAEREVRQIHEAYYKTLVKEGPDAALGRYYSSDYTYLGVDGKIIDKAGLKARMKRNKLGLFTMEDDLRRVSIYGDVAVLSGHTKTSLTDRGQEKVTLDGYTEVWVRREGSWQLVAEQITPQPS
ncbi:MAG: nuclear transport factor 2 family protein [Gammaproteobacteria bacterium]|nr:nuclear transport factor 2 family protein [Gammaproteobacteria bacterium]MDH3467855.1 nuclear transport factor 2 family protein [Gammaproteobacteria bacterium]